MASHLLITFFQIRLDFWGTKVVPVTVLSLSLNRMSKVVHKH